MPVQETFVRAPSEVADFDPLPVIYTRTQGAAQLSPKGRLGAGLVACGCLAVLLIAAWLRPDKNGFGTHAQLGFQACQFKARTGLPCPSCGFTTAFTCFAHGKFLSSFYVQPMGALLALATAAAIWGGAYVAITGRPVYRLLRLFPSRYYLMPLLIFALLAWGWKVLLTLSGHDGVM